MNDSRESGKPQYPLEGIIVVDFTHAASGPFCTMILSGLGAKVIKIEHPTMGDSSRQMGEPIEDQDASDYFAGLNSGKRSLAIDLKHERGRDLALGLVANADVVVENFRAGVMDRFGLGYSECAKERPHLVYCSIQGFSNDGPWATRAANDIMMQSLSGLMAMTGEPEGPPVRLGSSVCDLASGLYAACGILAAIVARDSFPTGQHIRIPMFHASLALSANLIPRVLDLGLIPERHGSGHPQLVPYQAFRCSDNRYIVVGVFTDKAWLGLCRAIERSDLECDLSYSTNPLRLRHRKVLITALESEFAKRRCSDWMEILDAADVPNSPVLNLGEALRTPEALRSGTTQVVPLGDSEVHVATLPIRSHEWGAPPPSLGPPSLGADTERILSGLLGIAPIELAELRAQGIVR